MPYQWKDATSHTELCLWPHRSLSPRGFVTFMGTTSAFLALPLIAVLGTPILWGLLPFLAGAVALTWYFINRSYRDAELREDLTLAREHMELVRTNPRGPQQSWQANPYWVRVNLHEKDGPVENYVTLQGAGREVEIGAFLSADERVDLYRDLQDRLRRLDVNAH